MPREYEGRLCRLAAGHDWLLEGFFFSRMRHRVGGDPAELGISLESRP